MATHAAERDLLGELTPAEAEEFEFHFFACSECAEAIEHGQQQLMRGVSDLPKPPGTEPRIK
ncbi:MAG: zf-HC2 domain-containing protein [Acidobacteriaceae bacterium]|nr:zf-HC2 domain-containing protein [Acidobacteriaceae bacterium]